MPYDLHPDLLRWSSGSISDFFGELRCDVGETGAQFAVEAEVGFFGQVGGLEVVGAG